jgi:hypothetical protein
MSSSITGELCFTFDATAKTNNKKICEGIEKMCKNDSQNDSQNESCRKMLEFCTK